MNNDYNVAQTIKKATYIFCIVILGIAASIPMLCVVMVMMPFAERK